MSDESQLRYVVGKGYLEALKCIADSPHRNTAEREIAYLMPMSMLTGFALELYFKSWLLGSGRDSKSVRKFGHNVTALYAEAKLEKLPPIVLLDDLVDAVAQGHEDYTFRYLESSTTLKVLDWGATITVLDALDVAVDTLIGASASRGLSPGH